MKQPRFFEAQDLKTDQEILLSQGVSHHIHTVLRMQDNAELVLFNGEGGEFHCTLMRSHKKNSLVQTNEYIADNRTADMNIHLGQVIGKADKMEFIVQKAVEMGVASITPLSSAHSNFKLKQDKLEKKINRWQKTIVSACEQCGMNLLPPLKPAITFDEWIESCQLDNKWVLSPSVTTKPEPGNISSEMAITVGPEGGFSQREIGNATRRGFTIIQLGTRVLRTETAALAALAYLQGIQSQHL